MIEMIARQLRKGDARGQALPLTLVALAMGAMLVSPFLLDTSVNLLASRKVDAGIIDNYSVDAGVEWALWRLKNDPTLTTSAEYTSTPLEPMPETINGGDFPVTQIKYVPEAEMREAITPEWQSGGGANCYPFSSSEAGDIGVLLETPTNNVWVTLLAGSDPCQKPQGLGKLPGDSPYSLAFPAMPAGEYQLLVEAAPPGLGSLTINLAIASYDIRSTRNGRSVTARATASGAGVNVISWQLDQEE